jgi:hypothetical protein
MGEENQTEDKLLSLLSKKKLNKPLEKEINLLLKKKLDWNYINQNFTKKTYKRLSPFFHKKQIKESLEIVSFLNKKNINYVVLKGITLQHFNKKRRFSDLDIFIDKKNIEKVASLLIDKYDYKLKSIKWFKVIKKFNFNILHHIELCNPHKIPVEIHYFLVHSSFIDSKTLNLDNNKTYLNIDGIDVPCLLPELQLIEIILHGVYNHGFLINHKRWIGSINTIINNYNIDWKKFMKIISKLDNHEAVYRAVMLLNDIKGLKVNIPSHILKKIYLSSSKLRLFLTRKFNSNFLLKNNYINNYASSEEKFNRWQRKITILFNIKANKYFFSLFYYYYLIRSLRDFYFKLSRITGYEFNSMLKIFFNVYEKNKKRKSKMTLY